MAFYIAVLRRQFTEFCKKKLAEMDVTYGQIFIILYIGKRGKCMPKEISLALELDEGHLNRVLLKLIENGFIIRTKKDGRSNIVNLTSKGEQVFRKSRDLFYEWDENMLSSLSESEKQKLLELIKKITVYPKR